MAAKMHNERILQMPARIKPTISCMPGILQMHQSDLECLPVLYHSTDYISFPLGSLGPLWTFEDGVLLMYILEGVSSVANFITAYEESQ